MSKTPTMDHSKQFVTVASVKGNGMVTADLVFKTVLSEDNGDPNMAMQNSTPRLPITDAKSWIGDMNLSIIVRATTAKQPLMC